MALKKVNKIANCEREIQAGKQWCNCVGQTFQVNCLVYKTCKKRVQGDSKEKKTSATSEIKSKQGVGEGKSNWSSEESHLPWSLWAKAELGKNTHASTMETWELHGPSCIMSCIWRGEGISLNYLWWQEGQRKRLEALRLILYTAVTISKAELYNW